MRLKCPDGCCDENDQPRTFKNVQTLRMHLLHVQGDGTHPKRTMEEVDRTIFSPKILPEPFVKKSKSDKIRI